MVLWPGGAPWELKHTAWGPTPAPHLGVNGQQGDKGTLPDLPAAMGQQELLVSFLHLC